LIGSVWLLPATQNFLCHLYTKTLVQSIKRTQNMKRKEVVYLNEFKVAPVDYTVDPAFKELEETIERTYGTDYSNEELRRFQKVIYEYAKTSAFTSAMDHTEKNVFNEAVFYFGFFLINRLGGGFVRVGNMLSLNIKSENGDNYYLNFVKVVARFWD
jgi:hypothetical protein